MPVYCRRSSFGRLAPAVTILYLSTGVILYSNPQQANAYDYR